MPVLRQFVRSALAATLPRRKFLVAGPRHSSAVCLTFDDGPHPEHTPRLLDALREAQIPATFFIVGDRAEQHPDLIRRIVADGHTLGNHTFTHSPPSQTSARRLLAEVRRTQDVLMEVVGTSVNLFRPPHGKLTPLKLAGLWRQGQTVVLWNVDPKDYARPSADDLGAWFRAHTPRGGDIVLLHDNQPYAAGALGEMVAVARDRGLTFTTPTSWLPEVTRAG